MLGGDGGGGGCVAKVNVSETVTSKEHKGVI